MSRLAAKLCSVLLLASLAALPAGAISHSVAFGLLSCGLGQEPCELDDVAFEIGLSGTENDPEAQAIVNKRHDDLLKEAKRVDAEIKRRGRGRS